MEPSSNKFQDKTKKHKHEHILPLTDYWTLTILGKRTVVPAGLVAQCLRVISLSLSLLSHRCYCTRLNQSCVTSPCFPFPTSHLSHFSFCVCKWVSPKLIMLWSEVNLRYKTVQKVPKSTKINLIGSSLMICTGTNRSTCVFISLSNISVVSLDGDEKHKKLSRWSRKTNNENNKISASIIYKSSQCSVLQWPCWQTVVCCVNTFTFISLSVIVWLY